MHITGRYSIARIATPKLPAVLKSGKISHAKNQDMDEARYRKGCHEKGVEPQEDTLLHLQERDRYAWHHREDFIITDQMMDEAVNELKLIAQRMRAERPDVPPPRNIFHCRMCKWKHLCDAEGDIPSWWGIKERKGYSGTAQAYNLIEIDEDERVKQLNTVIDAGTSVVISPSAASTYMQCPRKWHYEYQMGKDLVQEKWNSLRSRTLGIMSHEGARNAAIYMEPNLFGEQSKQIDMYNAAYRGVYDFLDEPSTFDNYSESAREEMHNAVGLCTEVAARLVRGANKGVQRVLHIEQRFIFRIPGTYLWVTCQPDVVAKGDNGELIIIDHKTTSSLRLDEYGRNYINSRAMLIYAYAIKHGQPCHPIGDF